MRNQKFESNDQKHNLWSYWLLGLGSLIWLLLRSGTNPRRLSYPCQRAALLNSLGFLGYPLSLLGSTHLYRRFKRGLTLSSLILFILSLLILACLGGSTTIAPMSAWAKPDLPAWNSQSAVSNVFAVQDVPVPKCSLDGGKLPGTAPCNDPQFALHDDGIDALIDLMVSRATFFYRTPSHIGGIVGSDDIVVIKINNQWGGKGNGDGHGRLATNTDILKGLIWRIVQHPEGFTGEVVIAENAQPTSTNDWNVYPANAEDKGQSYQDIVDAFQSLGYPVSLYDWTALNESRIDGGSIDSSDYPNGEYVYGDMSDAYILLDDPAGTAKGELSYPKFQTANGHYVSMRYGVWNGNSFDSDRLTLINIPVLKRHGMAGATAAWKNLIGFISADGFGSNRFGGYDSMHDFFWGYTGGANKEYGLLGRQIALVRAPDLNLVDAIWVAYEKNYMGDAVRQDVLLASTDPFAVDWYASEYTLLPLTGDQNTSAARGGTFRSATRTNQNSAKLVWPGGSQYYPYIDLLEDYDGNTPTQAEKDQINVFVAGPSDSSLFLPLVSDDSDAVYGSTKPEYFIFPSSFYRKY